MPLTVGLARWRGYVVCNDIYSLSTLPVSSHRFVWSDSVHPCCRDLRVAYTMTSCCVYFSCMFIVKLVFWPENYPRNLISFVSSALSVWITLRAECSVIDFNQDLDRPRFYFLTDLPKRHMMRVPSLPEVRLARSVSWNLKFVVRRIQKFCLPHQNQRNRRIQKFSLRTDVVPHQNLRKSVERWLFKFCLSFFFKSFSRKEKEQGKKVDQEGAESGIGRLSS